MPVGPSTRTVVALCALVGAAVAPQAPQRPAFTARTDVALVDVQVVTSDGAPILDLRAEDFTVELDGDRRSIVAVDLVRYDRSAAPTMTAPVDPAHGVTATTPAPRRQYILAIDESSFSTAAALAWKAAIKRFVDRLAPRGSGRALRPSGRWLARAAHRRSRCCARGCRWHRWPSGASRTPLSDDAVRGGRHHRGRPGRGHAGGRTGVCASAGVLLP